MPEKFDEGVFQEWYKMWAERLDLNPDSDDPRHKYDYRAAYMAGAEPQPNFEDRKFDWPSQFKADDHPNRYVDGIDTKTNLPVSEPESKVDEFGGTEVETETDEFGGTIFNPPPSDQKFEKPLPLGQRLIDKYVRPTLQGLGSVGGIIIGGGGGGVAGTAVAPGPGTATGTILGAVAGETLGYAMGDEVADILQEWFGYYKPLPVMLNLQEAGENIREGATYAMGGYSAVPAAQLVGKGLGKIPGVKRMTNWATSMFPKTKGQAEEAAGEVLAAFTAKGPLVAKNVEEAKAIEELIGGGFKFDLGQLTGDINVVKFMKEGLDDAGDLAVAQAEQMRINTIAINKFIKKTKGKGTTKDFLKPLSDKERIITDAEAIAKSNLERQQGARKGQIGDMEGGAAIRGEMEAGESAAREVASEKFAAVPNQNQIVDDLYDGFQNIMKPSHKAEGPDKFPKVLTRGIKIMKDSMKAPKGAVADDVLAKAKADISKAKPDDLIYHYSEEKFVSGKPDKGSEGYFFGDETWTDPKIGKYGPMGGIQWGPNLHAIRLPKNAKIINLKPKTDKKSLDIVKEIARLQGSDVAQPPKDPKLLKEWIEDDSMSFWANKKVLTKVLKKYGYDGARFEEEFFIPKKTIAKSKAYDPKTLQPITSVKPKPIPTDEPTMTLKDIQGLRSEILEDLRTAKDKGLPRSLRSRLAKAVELIDQKLGTSSGKEGKELQAAQKFFREEVIEKYGKGSVGKILRGEESVQDAIVAGEFFKTGPAGEQAAVEFMNIMGDNPAAKTALKEHINQKVFDLQSDKTGEITKAALNRFLKLHRPALKKLGMENEFNTLMKAREAADKALAVSKEFEKSVASKVLGADVNDIVKKAFSGTGSKKKAAEELIKEVKGNKKATLGLQNAMVDEILTEVPLDKPIRDLLTSTKMADQFRKYDAALKVVFKDSPKKLKAMHVVRRAVKALEYKTGQTAGEGERYAADVVRRMAFLYGHSTVAAADIARKTVRVLKGISKEKIHKFINRGILDPEVAYSLMQAARGGSEKRMTQGIVNNLVRLGLIAQPKKQEIDQWFTTRKGKH